MFGTIAGAESVLLAFNDAGEVIRRVRTKIEVWSALADIER